MTPPTVTEVDDSAAAPIAANPDSMIDTAALDAAQRRETHPFAVYCKQVREAAGISPSQAAREVVSAVCNAVAKLSIIEDDTAEEQAEHIAKMVAKDREEIGDKQLWTGPATRIAKIALQLRKEGKAVVADSASEEPAVEGATSS